MSGHDELGRKLLASEVLINGEPIRFALGLRPREAPELRYRGRVVHASFATELTNVDRCNYAKMVAWTHGSSVCVGAQVEIKDLDRLAAAFDGHAGVPGWTDAVPGVVRNPEWANTKAEVVDVDSDDTVQLRVPDGEKWFPRAAFETTLLEKAACAAAAGAVALIVVNDSEKLSWMMTPKQLEASPIPMVMVRASAAEALVESCELSLTLESGDAQWTSMSPEQRYIYLSALIEQDGDWPKVSALLATEQGVSAAFHVGDYQYQLLHRICCVENQGAPLEVIQTLVEANPAALAAGSGSGTPLDNAKTNNATPEVLMYLRNYAPLLEAAQGQDWARLEASQRADPASWILELATDHGAELAVLNKLRTIGAVMTALREKEWRAFGTERYERLEYPEDQTVAIGVRVTHKAREGIVTAMQFVSPDNEVVATNGGKVKIKWADDESSSEWIEVNLVAVVNQRRQQLPLVLTLPICTALEHSGHRLPLDTAIESDDTPPEILERLIETSGGIEAIVDVHKRTSRTIMLSCKCERYRLFAESYGTFLGRYKIIGETKHRSATSVVVCAEDVQNDQMRVALKRMHDKAEWLREQEMRQLDAGIALDSKYIVPLLEAIELNEGAATMDKRLKDHSDSDDSDNDNKFDGNYLLVMPLADNSLADSITSQRRAGRDVAFARGAGQEIAEALQYLHIEQKRVHRDVKPKNVLKFGSHFKLADMDAAGSIGVPTDGDKWSETYGAPELARHKLCSSLLAPVLATEGLDVWSFGALFYELVTGTALFTADRTDDKFVDERSQLELLNWTSIDSARLDKVLTSEMCPTATDAERHCAKHLCWWCLQNEPTKRPSMEQILAHPFFSAVVSSSKAVAFTDALDIRVSLHFFLSHFQKEANDMVKGLFLQLRELGCSAWLDMAADDITLEGMRRGVDDSDVFLLALSRGVLFRPFCIAEIYHAIAAGKRIMLVAEEDSRAGFNWDMDKFEAELLRHDVASGSPSSSDGFKEEIAAKQGELIAATTNLDMKAARRTLQEIQALARQTVQSDYSWCLAELAKLECMGLQQAQVMYAAVVEMIRREAPNIINFRRRAFEVDAMLAEILNRNGLFAPKDLLSFRPAPPVELGDMAMSLPVAVSLVATDTGAELSTSLQQALVARGQPPPIIVAHANALKRSRVLAVLSRGSASDPMFVGSIKMAVAQQLPLVIVQAEPTIAGKERATAMVSGIQDVFAQHEFMTYRGQPHEHAAMVGEIIRKFGLM